MIFDDTIIYRSSRKAPGSNIHHQHGNRTNRPQYARGKCWVTMALSITSGIRHCAVPLLSRLMRASGNLTAGGYSAFFLPQTDRSSPWSTGRMSPPRSNVAFKPLARCAGIQALHALSVQQGGRGRPRKYGNKYTPELVATLKVHRSKVFIYRKMQWVRYRSVVCLARFMKGRQVRAVWMQFEDSTGKLSKQRLLLSTCATLTAEEVFQHYASRWLIEDLLNTMKNRWGWRETWQVLHRWTQIASLVYALPQLLAMYLRGSGAKHDGFG